MYVHEIQKIPNLTTDSASNHAISPKSATEFKTLSEAIKTNRTFLSEVLVNDFAIPCVKLILGSLLAYAFAKVVIDLWKTITKSGRIP
jgi:hypothetical protein